MNLFDYIEKGGPVMYILFVLNIIGYTLMAWKLVQFLIIKKRNASDIYDEIVDSIKEKYTSSG